MIADTRNDRELLRAYSDGVDEGAFAELVLRHGPLVLGVCQRVLRNPHDADDAFQAAFLVLAKKARGIRRPELLGNWLYGVALRCARRVKSKCRSAEGHPVNEDASSEPDDWHDVRPILDEEVARLPEKLRSAVVLCEIEGVPRPEAAHRLGVPEGTLSSRLARAKEALRTRLLKRGITIAALGLGTLLSSTATGAVPPALVKSTTAAAIGFTAGTKTAGVAVSIATEEIVKMFWVKVIKFGLAALTISGVAGGAAVGFGEENPHSGGLSRLHNNSLFLKIHSQFKEKKTDKDLLQGEWTVTAAKVDGKDPGDKLALKEVTFEGDAVTLAKGQKGEYTLDATKKPKELTIKVSEGPHTGEFPGIYKLDGEVMTFHFSTKPGADRPTDFDCKEGGNTALLTMKRAKK